MHCQYGSRYGGKLCQKLYNNYGGLKHIMICAMKNGKNVCLKNFLSDSRHLPYTSFFFYNIKQILACGKWQILRCFENGVNKKIRT